MLKSLLISEWMTKDVVTIDVSDNTKHAFYLLKSRHIRFLPVVDKNRLVGVVTDRDLRLPDSKIKPDTSCYHFDNALPVKKIMTRNPLVLLPNDNLETAARIFVQHKFGGLPIVDRITSNKVIGVLTVSDVMRAMVHVITEKKL